jgi:soluble lytic murein transglycosylase-like protein
MAFAYAGNPRPGYETQWQAKLRNGFSIRHVTRETLGSDTRLWITPGKSYVDVPTDQIAGFEEVEVPVVQPIAAATSGVPKPAPRVEDLVNEAGQRTAIDPAFIASVIKAESGNNPRAVSPKGARGLMQLMPQTASQLGVANSFDPSANVDGGTRYLQALLEQYHGDAQKALAAYNAGPHRVQQYRGVPPYHETRTYVARVINDYNRRKLAQQRSQRSAKPRKPVSGQSAGQ